jgi:hypothetical protein
MFHPTLAAAVGALCAATLVVAPARASETSAVPLGAGANLAALGLAAALLGSHPPVVAYPGVPPVVYVPQPATPRRPSSDTPPPSETH